LRCVGWGLAPGEDQTEPGPDSANQGIDLFVGEHSASALRKGGHCSAAYSVGGGAANHGIVSDRQENGSRRAIVAPPFPLVPCIPQFCP